MTNETLMHICAAVAWVGALWHAYGAGAVSALVLASGRQWLITAGMWRALVLAVRAAVLAIAAFTLQVLA